MKITKVLAYVLSASVMVACGGHEEPENNDEDLEDAITALSALGSAAAGAMEADEAMNKDENEAAEKIEKKLIHYKELRSAIPDEIDGFTKTDEDGETVKMGVFSVSQASKEFENGDKELSIEVLDYALAAVMLQSMKMAGNIEVENDEKYHKGIKLDNGIMGWEEYQYTDKKSIVVLVLNDRLLLNIEVDNAEPGEALKIAKELDLDEFKSLIN